MSNNIISRHTVARDLVLWLTMLVSLIITLLAISYYFYSTTHLEQELAAKAETITAEISGVMLPPLRDLNFAAVKNIAKVYQQNPYISGLRVKTDYGKVIFDSLPPGNDIHLSRDKILRMNKVELGFLTLHFTNYPLRERQQTTLLTTILITLLILAVMVLGTIFFMRRCLQQPLERLATGVKLIAQGKYDEPMLPVAQEDLSAIIREVNTMAAQISTQNRQLVDSAQQYRSIFDNAQGGIFQSTPDGRFLKVNPAMARILGYRSPEELLASDFDISRLYAKPEERQRLLATLAAQSHISGFEIEVVRKDGAIIKAALNIYAVKDKDGNINYLEGVLEDISRRKQVEDQLLGEKTFSDALINCLPGIFYVYNEEQRLIRWNKNHETISGYSPEELAQMHVRDWFDRHDLPRVSAAIKELFVKSQVEIEAHLIIKGGTKIPYIFTATPLRVGGENFFVGIGLELTERKRLEAELRQAQKMEAIGTLAGGIAHDFNNILTGIFGYTQLAMGDIGDPKELQRDLDQIYRGSERAKDLVAQILTFSRRTEHEKKPLKLYLILKEAIKLLRASLPATIEIKQKIAPRGTVLADATQIHQVIMNLCTNAFHAMRETGGVLAVSLREVTITADETPPGLSIIPGQYLCLEIGDSGCGMDKETCEKIFEPYFTTKEAGEGTGLGLAVVHGIVQSHQGYIDVYSEPGRGTTFHIYLPLVADKEVEIESGSADEPIVGGTERIMLIDDELPIVDMLSKVLENYGYQISIYGNGMQGWQDFQKRPQDFDLLITDYTMPYMTGLELSMKILELRADMPIILCSGYSEAIYKDKAFAVGVKGYLSKPLDVKCLLRCIRKVLAGHDVRPPNE